MVRKNYPFNEREIRKTEKFISRILVGLILAPFVIIDSLPKGVDNHNYVYNTNNSNKPLSKFWAIIFALIGLALVPVFISLISFAFQIVGFPVIGLFIFLALLLIPVLVWGAIICAVVESFTYNNKIPKDEVNQQKTTKGIF